MDYSIDIDFNHESRMTRIIRVSTDFIFSDRVRNSPLKPHPLNCFICIKSYYCFLSCAYWVSALAWHPMPLS